MDDPGRNHPEAIIEYVSPFGWVAFLPGGRLIGNERSLQMLDGWVDEMAAGRASWFPWPDSPPSSG